MTRNNTYTAFIHLNVTNELHFISIVMLKMAIFKYLHKSHSYYIQILYVYSHTLFASILDYLIKITKYVSHTNHRKNWKRKHNLYYRSLYEAYSLYHNTQNEKCTIHNLTAQSKVFMYINNDLGTNVMSFNGKLCDAAGFFVDCI